MAEIEKFLKDFEKDPETTVKNISHYIEKFDDNDAFIKALVGPDYALMLRAIGSIYSSLNRELREEALSRVISELDRLNYFYAQNHVMMIDDPWLVSDILMQHQQVMALHNAEKLSLHAQIQQRIKHQLFPTKWYVHHEQNQSLLEYRQQQVLGLAYRFLGLPHLRNS